MESRIRSRSSCLSLLLLAGLTTFAHAGPATHFSVVVPSPITSYTNVTAVVTALDASQATDTGYAGTVHFTSTDPGFVSPPDQTLTNGTASANFAFKQAGTQTMTVTDTVNASITGTSNPATVVPGPTQMLQLSLPGNAIPGVSFNFTVTAADLYGNITPAYAGTVHFTSSDASATLPADGTLTNGQGTFAATLQARNTSVTITATDTMIPSVLGSGSTGALPVTLQEFHVE